MALIVADRVLESSTTTGSGVLTLAGAVNGDYRAASSVCANGDTFYYYIEGVDTNGNPDGSGWETGLGTWGTGSTLTRTTVHASSNAGSAVSWSAGTRRVAMSLTATMFTTMVGTVDGTNPVGFRHIPQNSQSTAYTLVLTDAGKHILHPSADTTARTITIPANSSVAFPIGAAVTFINQASAGVITIAITTDTMRLAGAGTTGSRTLAANGFATAIKLTSTEWIISGTGLT